MTNYWDPKLYIDRDARIASGDTPPPLPRKIGFVTQSPGDLYLASKGLSSQTKALVTKLTSATEIQTARNEVIQVRSLQTGATTVAVDIGASASPEARDLLVLSETPVEQAVEGVSSSALAGSEYDVVDSGADAPVNSGPSQSAFYLQQLTEQQAATDARQAASIENSTPSAPTQYVAPPASYVAPSTYLPPPPPPPAPTWVSAGAYIVNDYEAYLVGL